MKDQILKALNWRYATKIFDPNLKISSEKWEAIESAFHLSASSFGLEPWKFLLVQNAELRAKLRPASWNQSQITDCSHLVVVCAKKNIDWAYMEKSVKNIASVRGASFSDLSSLLDLEKGHFTGVPSHFQFSSNQAYIALGKALLTAALLEVDACPIEGFNPVKYNEILEIPQEYVAVTVCAFGYRSKDDKYATIKKARFPKNEVFKEYK